MSEQDFARIRDCFLITDADVCYLDGNSLGRQPKAAVERIQQVSESWGKELVGGWNTDWYDLSRRIGAKIARIIGARPHEVILADSTSVNLFKLALAALRYQTERSHIVTTADNFPSDLYIIESASRATCGHGAQTPCNEAENACPHNVIAVDLKGADGGVEDKLVGAMQADTALVTLSHVDFRSGYLYDLPTVTRAAHDVGALTLWDLSHSIGAVPINLGEANVDLAVGCTYKYLCGGPGSPAFLYVREDLQSELQNPVAGWFSHRQPFEFQAEYSPASGIQRFLTGTPPILSLAAVEAGVDLVLAAGLNRLRDRSESLTTELIELYDRELRARGFELRTPRDAARRGSHISLGHPEAQRITQVLIERYRVIPDFRKPDNLRLGVAPMYTTEKEIRRAISALVDTIDNREFERIDLPQTPVT